MLEWTGLSLGQVLATLGAFGAAVFVLYLLKLRRRPVEVPFVRLWHDVLAEQRTTRLFSSLKRILSLLLALSIVAMLAIALGDPRWIAGRDDGRTLVVLVDTSASMGATDVEGGRIEAARQAVRRRIAAMGADDRMIVASMGASTVPLGPIDGDPEVLEEALDRLEARDVAADLARGLGWALDVARGAPSAEIVIVSDGRLDAPGELVEARARESGVPVRWDRVGETETRNVAITAFAVRRYPIDKSRAQVLIELWNPGANAEEIELTLLGDSHEGEGVPLDVTTMRLGAGERATRLFENVTGADRTLEARIRLADGTQDDLAADDRAYARLPERRRARVLVVAEDDIYLEAALLLDEYLAVTHVTPAQFPPEGEFDVVIYESFVPPQPLDAPSIWLHPQPAAGVQGPLVVEGTIERPFFDRLERDHPLLAFTSLRDVNIAEALQVRVEPGDVVVGADARGPLLVTGTRNGRGFVALTFDPRRSDLPLRVAWPLLLLHAIDSFVEEASGHFSSYRTGEPWYVPVSPSATRATLIDDGSERPVPIVDGRAVATSERAGFHLLLTDGPDAEHLAVNLGPSGEAELAVAATMPIAGEPSDAPTIVDAPVRGEPWAWLVLIAFGVLAIEWVTFHRRWTV
ncbi:vWA domain-containing protein [Sandaracinus amylolyticus]|uniref:VWFA domain-containing protein n=1 Tax=Sandaracinus amylolyticus TaxID=927083 RepID=A0A0F6W3F5_9BACT|nr:VWA domain-containing protein [Sandaracinus amylolyticus]AKF06302.1 hypothetical protein DB32_003451 [Sandaracinus amylolyticus]